MATLQVRKSRGAVNHACDLTLLSTPRLPKRYPKVAPNISLEEPKGLSSQHVTHLVSFS